MLVHTKKPSTEGRCMLRFVGPATHVNSACEAMKKLGFEQIEETMPWRKAFPQWGDTELPGVVLAGARHKERLTQVQLAKLVNIPQRHISEMENGKRPIGKERAKKLARVLDMSYKTLL